MNPVAAEINAALRARREAAAIEFLTLVTYLVTGRWPV